MAARRRRLRLREMTSTVDLRTEPVEAIHPSASFSTTSGSGSRTTPVRSPGSPERSATPAGCSVRSTSSGSRRHEGPRRHDPRGRRRPHASTSSRPSAAPKESRLARLRPDVPAPPRRQDRDERRRVALKTRDDLSMAYTPGVARVSQAIAADPAKAWTLTIKQQHGRGRQRRHRGARSRRHRPGGRDAGDGGQGDPLQGVRRHRRLADLPRDEGPDEIVRDVQGDRARLRRDQPRGHLGAALLRDRGAAAGGARHPGLPRRPARHRDRRARRAAERARRSSASSSRTSASS